MRKAKEAVVGRRNGFLVWSEWGSTKVGELRRWVMFCARRVGIMTRSVTNYDATNFHNQIRLENGMLNKSVPEYPHMRCSPMI